MKEIKYGNFSEDLNRGKQGEEEIFTLLDSIFGEENVIDVRDSESARENDIDAIVIRDGKCFSVEIKTDFTESENFFAELVSCAERNTLGCWLKTKANYIMYYFKKQHKCYIIPTELGRTEACSGKYRQVEAKDKIGNDGARIKTSIGALIPVKVLAQKVSVAINSEDLFYQPVYPV